MRYFKLILAISIVFSFIFGQVFKPEIYIGTGLGTNIGGIYGIGIENKFYENISINFAVGSGLEDITMKKFGYDFGLKYYIKNYIFLGINYGLIDYTLEEIGYASGHIEKYNNNKWFILYHWRKIKN